MCKTRLLGVEESNLLSIIGETLSKDVFTFVRKDSSMRYRRNDHQVHST